MDKIDILIEESLKQHLGNNWGKYLASGASLAGAAGLAGASDMNPETIPETIPEVNNVIQPKIDNVEQYSNREADLLKYLRKDLPNESFQDMKKEIESHTEKPWISQPTNISPDYNQGFVNTQVGDLFKDGPSGMTRAEVSNYVDHLYDKVNGKNNQYMDYGDEDQGLLNRAKDKFGLANSEGTFNDAYMKNLDDEKHTAVQKIMGMRDDLKRFSK